MYVHIYIYTYIYIYTSIIHKYTYVGAYIYIYLYIYAPGSQPHPPQVSSLAPLWSWVAPAERQAARKRADGRRLI